MLKVGLIGCGGITKVHVEGWKKVADRARVVAVADVSDEAARIRIDELGYPAEIYKDYRDLLANKEIEAVDLCLPHHLHCESITRAALAGKHLMTEKPLCRTLEEAEEVARTVHQSGIIMMAAHNQLFFPTVLQAKNMIMSGDLGKVYMIDSIDAGARRRPLSLNKATWGGQTQAAQTWRQDPELMGGGELIDTGYHPTYRLLFLAGQKPVEVAGMIGTYRLPMAREDTANVILKFADGAMGQVFSSWGLQTPGGRPALFHVNAENGQLWGEMDRLYYLPVGFQQPATIEYPGWDYARTFAAEISHFVDAIEGHFEPLNSVDEAVLTLQVILAAYRSVSDKVVVQM